MRIVISSGHGLHIRGASGIIDEVDEARLVVNEVAARLREVGVEVTTYHDDVSDDQSENLQRIVDFHNGKSRDLDVSVHFNAYQTTSKPMGTEVLYVTQDDIAADVSAAIAEAGGFIDRGAKHRGDLAFLNNTEGPAILIETCFVDSQADVALYREHFTEICAAIASSLTGEGVAVSPPPLTVVADIPPWLATMRMITGVSETPGDADNPKILAAAQFIGDEYPEMESYCDQYTHDSIAWCGLCVAYVMTDNGIRPQFGPAGDTDKFLWAQSWLNWGQPCMPVPGCVMIFSREGGGHVTLLEEVTSSGSYKCRGGNQSDSINVATYSSGFLGSRWPPGYDVPRPAPEDMPTIEKGDTGPAVMEAQRLLGGLEIDGDFWACDRQCRPLFPGFAGAGGGRGDWPRYLDGFVRHRGSARRG